jgi:type VI secretion system secreted protein Hcp
MGISRRAAIRRGFLTAAGLSGLKIIGPAIAVPAAMAADVPAAGVIPMEVADVPFVAFLRLVGIPGDSTDQDHKGEIEVRSYSFGVTNTGSGGVGGGSGQGKATFTDVALTAAAGSASPLLLMATASGNHFPEAVLTLRRDDAERLEFMKVTLEDVVISGYQQGGDTVGDVSHETINLNFAVIKVEFTPQSAGGGPGPVTSGGWDVRQNQPAP